MVRAERLYEATLPRRFHSQLFDPDVAVAQQAAYSLVACSKSFSKGRKSTKIADLDATEIDHVREDLEKLLPMLGDKYYSYVDRIGLDRSRNTILLKARVRLSMQLPFSLNGRAVIIDGKSPRLGEKPDITIVTPPGAIASVLKILTPNDPEWREGDFFIADCGIQVIHSQNKQKLPISFMIDGLVVDGHSLKLR